MSAPKEIVTARDPSRAFSGLRAGSDLAAAIALPERFRPDGVAMLLGSNGFGRVFLCDRKNHFIDVVDQYARPLFSFGGRGTAPGQFNDPCDIVAIPPTDQLSFTIEQALVAVADRGNGRVQIFDGSGTLVAMLAPFEPMCDRSRSSGAPVIRTPAFARLSRLVWAPPYLVIADSNRRVVRVDLGLALYPTGRTTTARSAIRGALRRVLADHPLGVHSTRRAGRSLIGSAVRPPTPS